MSMVDYDLPACQRAAASAAIVAAGTGGKSGPPSPILSPAAGENVNASAGATQAPATAAAAAGK